MKINTHLNFQGNEIKLAAPEKVTTLPDSNLFIGRTCVLISEKEVDETTINVGSIYYYNGEQWCHIEVEPLKIDETKINVIDDEITVHKFDTLSDAKTYIDSNNKPKSVVIGYSTGVTSISSGAFQYCMSLTSVYIPDSVTSISSCAFQYCMSLTSVYIPDSVTSIGTAAFANCISLTSITIPNGVTSISSNAFKNCKALTSINIPSSVTSIGQNAFIDCNSLKSITIPNGVTSISSNAFKNCTALTSITISITVTSIGDNVFSGCDILLLDNYKSKTGYPWGATDIYIQNEEVTTTIDENSTDRQVPTAKAIYDFTTPILRYGFRIDKNNSDPDTRVEYLYDAVGMTPAKMTYDGTTHKGTFDYGSWSDVWFIKNNRPVKLNFNGTVEAELNPNNYWKTVEGLDSGLETSTNCNFMSEIPIVYVKRWEDENYNYVVVCDKQYDEDYLAYANTDKDGNLKPLYAPMFKGYKDSNNILRSIAGVIPLNYETTSNEVTYSNNINTAGSVTGWQIEDIAKHELISDLLTLISKNTNSQAIFGNGIDYNSYSVMAYTGYNEIKKETKKTKSACGQFCGYNTNSNHVSVFYIQDFWGNRWDRCLGLITSGNKYYYKMTPENGGYTYTSDISDYTNNGYTIAQDYNGNDITPPTKNYIKNQSTGIFGNLPTNTTGASNSTYYCDYYYYNSSGVCLLQVGGSYVYAGYCGTRCFNLSNSTSNAISNLGASPFYV